MKLFQIFWFFLLTCLLLTFAALGLTFGLPSEGRLTTQLLLTALLIMELGMSVLLWFLGKNWNQTAIEASGLDPAQVELARKEWERQLEAESARIDQKSRKLAERYRAINEWMDYPQILDLQTGAVLPGQQADSSPVRAVVQSEQLARQDRLVREILDVQAEVIYEKIRRNDYSPQGVFQPFLLRDDLHVTAIKIAQVYQPQLDNPLLSTSPEQIARALNRIGLHLLVVMDQLPLDLKSYNIQKTYDTVRHAITTYGAYKKASPYLDWASKGLYLGRMVTSTNPIALGLLWGATELGKFGAQKLANHLIDRQAIGLLQSVIRVVGYEVAAIYGGDFRYRDPNWCYAVEMTQLLAAFPSSRESLQYGFQEIGRLQLRNEYDRLAVYRSLASGKVISRKQTHPDLLTEREKQQIIELLEKAYREVLHGQSSALVEKWKKGVQNHLGLQLSLNSEHVTRHESRQAEQNREMLTFLVGFLCQIKMLPVSRLEQYFAMFDNPDSSPSIGSREQLKEIVDALQKAGKDNVFEFLPPDIDPKDPRVDLFLKVLSRLNAVVPAYSPEMEQLIIETGFYYRRTIEQSLKLIYEAYWETVGNKAPQLSPSLKDSEPLLARELLYLEQDSLLNLALIEFVYFRQVQVNHRQQIGMLPPVGAIGEKYYLVVEKAGLKLVHSRGLEESPEIIWVSGDSARVENKSSMLMAEAELVGGKQVESWQGRELLSIRIQAPMTARYQQFFEPLLRKISDNS